MTKLIIVGTRMVFVTRWRSIASRASPGRERREEDMDAADHGDGVAGPGVREVEHGRDVEPGVGSVNSASMAELIAFEMTLR